MVETTLVMLYSLFWHEWTLTRRLGEERLGGGGDFGAEGGDDVVDEAAAVGVVHPQALPHRVVDEHAHEHLGPDLGFMGRVGWILTHFWQL